MHLGLSEPDPEAQSTEEHASLRHGVEGVDDLPVQQLEVGGGAHVDPGCLADQPVEAVGSEAVKAGLFAAVIFDPLNDLVALLPEAVHLDNLLGRVLQITVEHDTAVAAGFFKPGEHCGLFAEVPAEADAADPGILFPGSADFMPCAIL